MQVRIKGGKSRNAVFFQWFVAPEGRKVGSLKRRMRSHLARWEMKSCTPLWREAHVQVKMYKTHQGRSTCCVEKVQAVVPQSTFRSQKCQKQTASDHFWTFRCRFVWPVQGILFIVNEGFCGISKNDGRRGTFEDDLERCISRGRRSTRDMLIRDIKRSGHWFPKRGCVTGAALCMTWHHFFVAGAEL